MTTNAKVACCELTGRPWKADHFRHKYAEVRALAAAPQRFAELYDVSGLTPCASVADALFMDTRDTAVTKLATAGCTIPEICSITGHSERSAHGSVGPDHRRSGLRWH